MGDDEKKKKREKMELIVCGNLWFYLQNVYVALLDWKV